MVNLNIESKDSSSDFQQQLKSIGLFVTHYQGYVHVEGDTDTVQQALALAASYDFASGVAKDVQATYEKAVQVLLDGEAQKFGYDSVLSACSYAGYVNPFQVEGQSFLAWRGAVWEYCYLQLDLVNTGQRAKPTVDELIAELPARQV